MAEKKDYSRRKQYRDSLLRITILKSPGTENTPPYHVHQKDGVLICNDFLLGRCPLKEQCPFHHTPYPYHWQWLRKKDHVWLSFSISAQHHLERLFCSPDFTEVTLKSRTHVFQVLELDTMKIFGCQICCKIRRLSNSTDYVRNPHFPERWEVFKKREVKLTNETAIEPKNWIEYDLPIAEELVAAFEKGMWNHAFFEDNRLYNVNLKSLTEHNIKAGSICRIRVRPALRNRECFAPFLRSIAQPYHTAAIRGEDPLDLYCGPYPAAWVPSPKGNSAFTMIEVAEAEMAYYVVNNLFHESLSKNKAIILSIYRIRNDHLWQAYMRQKEIMSRGRTLKDQRKLERHLFHGTGAAQIKSICTMNFNPHLAGKHNAVYGKGIYFAKNAFYSNHFARVAKDNVRHMFLAKVLTGYWQKGREMLKRPRRKYNSCADHPSHPSMFVVFKSCQCYPYFVIRYKEVNTSVDIDL